MPFLTDDERDEIIRCLTNRQPLAKKWLEKLFPLDAAGELMWKGKFEAVSQFEASCATPRESGRTDGNPAFAADGWQGLVFQGDNRLLMELLVNDLDRTDRAQAPDTQPDHSRVANVQTDFEKTVSERTGFGTVNSALTDTAPPGRAGSGQASHGLSPFSLIYIDPPFCAGTDFHVRVPRVLRLKNEIASENELAYSDTWHGGRAEYFSMLYPRLLLMRELLSSTGVLCVHCDWRAAPGIRFMLDECFGSQAFVNEIIWHYTGGGRSKRYFSRKHDCLLVYAKGKDWTFNVDAVRVPYKETSGYAKSGIVSKAGKRYTPHPKGTPLDDVWDIPMLNPMSHERVAYATQKPLMLLERVIEAFTNKGDLVGDFFCGSGTALVAAASLKRRFIGCDFSKQAVQVTSSRLESIPLQRANGLLGNEMPYSVFSGE